MKKKRFLCVLMVFVMILTSVPTQYVMANLNSNNSSVSNNLYDYTIFAGSYDEDAIVFNAGNICVNGNIGTNGTIKSLNSINGNGQKNEYANVNMPNFWKWIEDNSHGSRSIIKNDNITLNGEVRFNQDDVIATREGDISVDAVNVDLNGLVYAPNGTISIKAQNLNMNSIIIVADKIVIDCPNMNANYNNTIGSGLTFDDTIKYTVTFDLCGVETTEVAIQNVVAGEYAIKPETPTNDNYTFIGWYLDKNLESYYDFDESPVNKDITLYAGWYDDNDTTDTDKDGFCNEYEKLIGTDVYSNDTDADGIFDYDELYYDLNTDPCNADTDGDGVYDREEDSDNDGVTNIKEFELKIEPDVADTDGDGIDDGEEVYTYLTEPKHQDTDEDGLDDYKEILYNADPLTYNETFDITANVKKGDSEVANISFSLSMNGLTSEQVDSLIIEPVYNETLFPYDMPGYIGCPYDLTMSGEFKEATLCFEYESELNEKENFDPVIYYFDEEEQDLIPLETTVVDNIATAVTTHFSTYVLVDRQWLKNSEKWKDTYELEGYTHAEVSIVLDDSGSMRSNDSNNKRLSVARSLVEDFPDNVKASIYKFASYHNRLCGFTNDKKELKKYLSTAYFDSYGNTCLNTVLLSALDDFKNDDKDLLKIIVVLTDGAATDSDKSSKIIKKAKNNDVKIYSVGLGYKESYFKNNLKPLSNKTGGEFFYASDAKKLNKIYDKISDKISIVKDSDNDGLPDFYEEELPCFNGKVFKSDKNNADTDGDGLSDGEEVVIKKMYNISKDKIRIVGKLKSNPTLQDSDGDGLLDNASIKRGNSIIAPKDNDCLKYNGIYNMWKRHIYEMKNGDVGESYLDEGSQAKVKKEIEKLTDKYIKDKKNKDKYKKVVEWAINKIEKTIRKEIIEHKDDMNLYLTEHEDGVRKVLMAIKKQFTGEITAAVGAYILNFTYDNKKSAYHSHPVTWQKTYGYNDFFDTVFRTGSNMEVKKIEFKHNYRNHILWMWKGDYWNLGTGSEIGLYKQALDCNTHYDAVDFLSTMQLSTYEYSKGQVYGSYYNWDPINDRQWWITAFDWRHPNPKTSNLVTIGKVNFGSKEDMAEEVNDAAIEKETFCDTILDKKNNTIWIMWR